MLKLITISGLDGSGKSTQIEMLKKYLEAQGKSVFYFHAITFSLANKFSVKKSTSAKSVTRASRISIRLRKIFLTIDLWRFERLYNKLSKEVCDYILSDRYFYDSDVNIQYLSSSSWKPGNNIRKPDTAIYLKTSPDIIMSRDRKPDQGIEYLQKKDALYDTFAREYNLIIINGNRVKEKIFKEIVDKL